MYFIYINRAFLRFWLLSAAAIQPVGALLHHFRTKGVACSLFGLQNYNKKMIYASKSSNFAKLFAYMKKKQYLCRQNKEN
jgi:hypothetical protein